MHLNLDELLGLRDGATTDEAASHAARCPACTAELARLEALRRALGTLPEIEPEVDLWPAIRSRLEADRRRRRWWRVGWVAASLFIAVTLVAALRGGIEALHEARIVRETRRLEAQSQQLEDALRAYQRSSAMSGRTAGTVIELEDRIAVIDARLAQFNKERTPSPDELGLWRQRVTLLDALVSMHGASKDYLGL
jgi:exonuclease VII small subunit